jgi:Cu+-exporting ATPase
MSQKWLLSRVIVAALCCLTLFLPLSLGVQGIQATIVQFFCGWPFYASRKNRDRLIAIGITAAYLFGFYLIFVSRLRGLYFETSTFLISFVLMSRLLEERFREEAETQLDALLASQSKFSPVKIGDVFIVQPGERIPADGTIEKGESVIDESLLTGNTLSVAKGIGSPIFAGTLNKHATIIGMATKSSGESALAHHISLLQNAQNSKASIQKLSDQTATFIIPLILTIALFTWIGWGQNSKGFIHALSVLLIGCPTAFFLPPSLSIAKALTQAHAKGIFIKDAKALEIARKVKRVIVEKNNIVTEETLSVAKSTLAESYLPIVKTLCEHSDLPAAKSLLEYLNQKRITSVPSMMVFRQTPRQGVNGYFDDRKYFLGSISYLEGQNINTDNFHRPSKEETGMLIALATEKLSLGYFVLSDRIKAESYEAIKELKTLGIQTVLLSTDQRKETERIATAVHFDSYEAELTPQDKVKFVQMAARERKTVAMVGDGIADASSLSAADIGFAIGTGNVIPMGSSSVGLMRSHLMGAVETIQLSRVTFQKIHLNLLFAAAYHLCAIPLAALGFIHPILAGAAMALTSVLLSYNAIRDPIRNVEGKRWVEISR